MPASSLKSATLSCVPTRSTSPSETSIWPRSGAPIATILCPTVKGGLDPLAQPSGTGRTDAMAAGSTHRIAISRPRSAASTRAATLMEGVSCTSAVVALPMTR